MAVELEYANSDRADGKKANAALLNKAQSYGAIAIREVVAGASNNSIYKMFADLNPELILVKLELSVDAFGAAATANIGIYATGATGAAFDDDVFDLAHDIATALKDADGMIDVGIQNSQKQLYKHAGHTLATKKAAYDIGIKLTNVGATGAGTIVMKAYFIQG